MVLYPIKKGANSGLGGAEIVGLEFGFGFDTHMVLCLIDRGDGSGLRGEEIV